MRLSKTFWLHNDFEDLAQSLQSGATGGKRGKYVLSAGDEKKSPCVCCSEQMKCCLLKQKCGKRQGWAGHRGGKGGVGCLGKVTDLIALAACPQPSSDTWKRILSNLNTLPAASVQIMRINGLKLNLCSCKRAVWVSSRTFLSWQEKATAVWHLHRGLLVGRHLRKSN